MWRTGSGSVRKALLLPALFLIVIMPIVVAVLGPFPGHMTPILLYPFASPWWAFFPDGSTAVADNLEELDKRVRGLENFRLLVGCAINAAILGGVGLLIDTLAGLSSRR